jgi:hypothetical protein
MEALVMSILFLSLNDGLFFHGPIISSLSPFTPPLQSLQWLDSYAYREVHPLHWAAVDSLVSQLGGIRNLKSFALPWLLSLYVPGFSKANWSGPCCEVNHFANMMNLVLHYSKPQRTSRSRPIRFLPQTAGHSSMISVWL